MKDQNASSSLMQVMSFISLVVVQGSHVLFLKLSQSKSGKYEYNTASAIAITEMIKFFLSAFIHYGSVYQQHHSDSFSLSNLLRCKCFQQSQNIDQKKQQQRLQELSQQSDIETNRNSSHKDDDKSTGVDEEKMIKGNSNNSTISFNVFNTLSKREIVIWGVLAFAYMINNQLSFIALMSIGPGRLALAKSFSPMLTAYLLQIIFNERITKVQWSCIILVVCGLVDVLYKPGSMNKNPSSNINVVVDGDNNSQDQSYQPILILYVSVVITSLCTVFNAKLLEGGKTPLQVQNMVLYFQGFWFNLFAFYIGFTPSNEKGFFDGYDNPRVWLVLLAQSTVGIVVSAVYKYGGAIVKTLAAAAQSAVLLVLDGVLFSVPWTSSSIAGAIVVLVSSYLYFSVAIPLKLQEESELKKSSQSDANGEVNIWWKIMRIVSLIQILLLFIYSVSMLLHQIYQERNPDKESLTSSSLVEFITGYRNNANGDDGEVRVSTSQNDN